MVLGEFPFRRLQERLTSSKKSSKYKSIPPVFSAGALAPEAS